MKIVLPGGSGQVGNVLTRALRAGGHEVIVLSRTASASTTQWDGRSLGPWADTIDGADVVINLAGRSVTCRYNKKNLTQMLKSRLDSTRVVGEAIARARNPPAVWLQMSTATIYSHRFDAPNDDVTGVLGGNEPDVPEYWAFSIEIAKAWEQALALADTRNTRKVALRTSMVMSPDRGGVFDILRRLTRVGLGGAIGGGAQFMSWIHGQDFVRAIQLLIDREEVEGPVALSSPVPLTQREFMAELRRAVRIPFGIPATKWMLEIATVFHRTDSELILKSRRVIPRRLLDLGFEFEFPTWSAAATDLVHRSHS